MYSRLYAPDGTNQIELRVNEMGNFFFNNRDYIFMIQ